MNIYKKLRSKKQYQLLSEYIKAKNSKFKIYEKFGQLKKGEIVTLLNSTKNHVTVKDKSGDVLQIDADDFFDVAMEL